MNQLFILFCALSPLQVQIDAIAQKGGGTLTLERGEYVTGALFFKKGVNLHLKAGATIIGSDRAEDYPITSTRIEGETCDYYPALINADHCDGFKISGEGVIDGHGANTWEEFWTTRDQARKEGREVRNKDFMRPRVLYVSNSKNVDISGVTFKNSKFWTTHFYNCEHVLVHDTKIIAEILKDKHGKELKGPSTDAIDIDKCHDFTVRNALISVNDDGVVIKGGKGNWANDYKKHPENGPSDKVLVENCTFLAPTHSCLTLGSECTEAKNIVMRNCKVDGAGNLLCLKMRTDTPQHYEKVLVERCEGNCRSLLSMKPWKQYAVFNRPVEELKSFAKDITIQDCALKTKKALDIIRDDEVYTYENLTVNSESDR